MQRMYTTSFQRFPTRRTVNTFSSSRRCQFAGATHRHASSSENESSTTSSDPRNLLVSSTQKWFHRVVLEERLCPFAAPLVSGKGPDKLRIVASSAATAEQAVMDVTSEASLLMHSRTERYNHSVETTLVTFDHERYEAFRNFREFVRLSWSLQEEAVVAQGLDGQLQLVVFHPNAKHDTYGEDMEDSAGDYTIRSPYPTIHLLREVDVVRAVQSGYPNLEELPGRNRSKLIDQGLEKCQERLRSCYVRNQEFDYGSNFKDRRENT